MPDGPRPPGPDYEDDFYAWTQYQAEVLRSLDTRDNRFDREHLAEEVADLGKSERDAVLSQVERILEHLLKLAYSPAEQPRYGWMGSIIEARNALRRKLSPSLRRDFEAEFAALYSDARERAEVALREFGEHAAADALPTESPFTPEQVLRRGWYPEPPEERK